MDVLVDIFFSLITLTALEVVLGIDNLVFIAICSSRLPKSQQKVARRVGLLLAWSTRLLLLASAVWLSKLTQAIVTVHNLALSPRDIFLFLGGIFLLFKSVQEIHFEIEPAHLPHNYAKNLSFSMVITQIALLDIVFSLDSILTAIGLTQHFWIMATAISIAILTMIMASESITRFITKHPTIKILALCFLMLIGVVLIADGFHFYIPRGYIYFAICFAILVELLNHLKRNKRKKH